MIEPIKMQQITEKLVELVRPHVFIYDVKSDKHRDGQRLQNVWESISMEMGVDGMNGKCGYNYAWVRERSLNQWRRVTFQMRHAIM